MKSVKKAIHENGIIEKEQALLTAIINSSDDGIISKDLNGTIMSWNAGAQHIFGYHASEVIGQPISILIPEYLLTEEIHILERIRQGKSINHYETVRKTKKGDLIDISLTISPIKTQSGTIIGASKIVRDITQNKLAQKELQRSKELLEQAEEIAGLGSWEIESGKTTGKWSKQMFRLFGLPVGEHAPSFEEMVDRTHPLDRDYLEQLIKNSLEGDSASLTFFRSNPEYGPLRYLMPTWKIERDAQSNVTRISGTLLDITEQKIKEQKIEKSEKLFRALTENSDGIIGLIDENLVPRYRPYHAERMTGYSLMDREKRSPLSEIHPDDLERFTNCLAEAKSKSGGSFEVSYRFKHKQGHYIWLETVFKNLLTDPDVGGIIYNTIEISERKNSEEKIINLNRTYDFISRINEAIIRNTEETELFNEVCRIAVDTGKFKMAWVGLANEETNSVEPVAQYGHEDGYLSEIKIFSLEKRSIGDSSPAGASLKSGDTFYCNDIQNDPTLNLWSGAASLRGYGSVISLPLKVDEKTVGAYTLYASVANFFNTEEVELLNRVAMDISFALQVFKKEKNRRVTERNLILSEEKYKDLFESNPIPTWVREDKTLKFLKVNRAAVASYGYTDAEFLQMTTNDIRPVQERVRYEKWRVENAGKFSGNIGLWKHQIKNGDIITVELIVRQIIFENRKAALIIAQDISDKLRSELKIKKINSELRDLSAHLQDIREEERKQIARDIHDELGQQLTGLKMDVYWINKKINQPSKIVRQKITDINILIDNAVTTVRRIAANLRPSILDDLGLAAALEWQSNEIETRFEIKVDFISEMGHVDLDAGLSTNLFRIYQEALTNAVRHANAKRIKSKLIFKENTIVLEIADDGKGMDLSKKNTGSFGILGIKERVFVIGGEYEFKSEPLKGTYLRVSVPLHN